MSYRRRHRWFRRMALGLAFASVVFAGRVSVAAAKFDEGTGGSRSVSVGGWSGLVDMESGIPLSAGIPHGDEPFVDEQEIQVIPYLSHGILGEDVRSQATGGQFIPGVTDFPSVQAAPLNRVERVLEQGPQVIPYLSHGMTADDVVGARPDNRADRFAHSDVPARPELASSSGSTFEWNDALTVGIGAVVFALGLGLALGYLRRPRLAGL